MARSHHTTYSIQRRTKVVIPAWDGRTLINRHTNSQRSCCRPVLGEQRRLRLHRGQHSITKLGEHREDPVAGALEHAPCVTSHGLFENLVVTRQCLLHQIGLGVPHRR